MLYIPYTDCLSRGYQLSPVTRYMCTDIIYASDIYHTVLLKLLLHACMQVGRHPPADPVAAVQYRPRRRQPRRLTRFLRACLGVVVGVVVVTLDM